jgi:hypothetical protein
MHHQALQYMRSCQINVKILTGNVVGSCCVLFRQSEICIGGRDWSWTLVSNCAFAVIFTGQQSLYIVVTPDSLERLANAQTFFMDGTFSVAPHSFKQLYTIRVPFKDASGTAVYAFLSNKCQDTYRGCWHGSCQQ